jgi:two-component system, OmpR family, response regulator PrrA
MITDDGRRQDLRFCHVAAETRAKGVILLVEDDPAVSRTFERMLQLADYDVVVAQDSLTGLGAMAETSPAAVIVELGMPMMNGLGLVRHIRERETNGRRTPIAVLTGNHLLDNTVRRLLHELQTELYFKPLWLNDLLQILDKLLASR